MHHRTKWPLNDERIKALVVAQSFHVTGGVNNFLRIMRLKYRPTVVATRFINGRRVREQGTVATFRRLLRDYLRFCVLLLTRDFDVLHVNPSFDRSSAPRELAFVWLARVFSPKTRVLVFYRGWDWSAFHRVQNSKWQRLLLSSTHCLATRLLVLAPSFKEALESAGVPKEKVYLTTTMFEGDSFPSQGTSFRDRRQDIVFLARFLPEKGGSELINAFARLAQSSPGLRLIMMGDGPAREAWEAQAERIGIAKQCVFTGYVSGTRKMEYLLNAKVLAFPSRHPEGMPNAILESMAAGLAIVSTDVGGIAEIVKDGVNGFILPSGETDEVYKLLSTLLSDEERLRGYSEYNRETAWRLYESKIVADRISRHYTEIVKGAKKGQQG